jgi:hypothetical protein
MAIVKVKPSFTLITLIANVPVDDIALCHVIRAQR